MVNVSGTDTRQARNRSVDILRMLAACSVVFIHYRLPGEAGIACRALARFAVPLFFAISGYYCADAIPIHLRKKMWSILRIAFVSCVLYLIWGSYRASAAEAGVVAYLATTFSLRNVAKLVFLNICPVSGHLWYLFAMLTVYLIVITGRVIRPRSETLRSLYPLGVATFAMLLMLDLFTSGMGIHVSYMVYRNGLFMGLPMFLMGNAIRRNVNEKDWLLADARKAALVAVTGVPLALLQEFGIGKSELPVGSIMTALGLLCLAVNRPRPYSKILRGFARLPLADASLAVYVIHIMVAQALVTFVSFFHGMGDGEHGSLTITTLIVSIVLGLVYGYARHVIRKLRVRHAPRRE